MTQIVDAADLWGPAKASPTGGGKLPFNISPEEADRYSQVESSHNPYAIGPVGAQGERAEGEMQVEPSTQRDPGFGVRPAKDKSPSELKRVGLDYLSAMKHRYKDPALTAIAYNWGPGNTDKWLARGADPRDLPKETQNYVKKIGAGRGLAQTPGGIPTPAKHSNVYSADELWGKPAKQAPKAEETFRGQRLLMNIPALANVVGGQVGQILGMGADMATYMVAIAKGETHEEATHEGRLAMQKIAGPIQKVVDHLTGKGEKAYEEAAVSQAVNKVNGWLDQGVDKVVEKTDGKVSREDAETMRDWLLTVGPIGVKRVVGKAFGKAAKTSEETSGVNAPLVEKYAKVGEEAEAKGAEVTEPPPLTPAPQPEGPPGKAPLPPPEKAPPAPIGQRVGAEAKTRLAEPAIIGEKPGPAPSGPPIYTGAKAPLDTGLAKVKAGQMFDLTAEERIALRQAGPSKLGKLGGQAGKADPKLLAKIALATGGAAAGAYFADRDKVETALAVGGVAALSLTAPRYFKSVRINWKSAMATTATTVGLAAGLAYLDKEHPIEGAIIGATWGLAHLMPKKDLAKINDLTIDDRANIYHGMLRANIRDVENMTRSLKLLVPDAARREELAHIIDEDKAGTLTGKERTAAMAYKGFMENYRDAAMDVGLMHDFVNNYVTRILEREGLPKTKLQEITNALFGEQAAAPAGGSARFAKGRARVQIGTDPLTGKPIYDVKYKTLRDLEKGIEGTGLKLKTKDLAEIVQIYGHSMGKAIQSKRYIDNLKGAYYGPDAKAANFIMDRDQAPPDYKSIDHPQMRGLVVHPELADSLRLTLESDNPGAAKAALLTLSMGTKRLGTSFSYFHLENMMTAQLGSMGAKSFWGVNAAIRAYEQGGVGDSVHELLMGGLNLGAHTVDESAVGSLGRFGQAIDSVIQRATGKEIKVGEKTLGGVEAVQKKAFDKVIWNYAHPGLKLNDALYRFEKELRKHPEAFPDENATPEQLAKAQAIRANIAKQVASYTNDIYGGLDWYRVATESNNDTSRKLGLSMLSPKGRGTLQILMFAPDWTFSTFRSIYKALPGTSDMPLTRSLHQQYMLRSGIMMMGVNNFFNYANTGHSVFQNKNKDGSPDWFRVHLKDGTTMDGFRHANEAYRLVQDPRGMVLSKLGYIPKTLGEDVFQKEYLTAKPGIGPKMEEGTLAHTLKNMSPFSFPEHVPGRSITETVKRAALGMAGVPKQGYTPEERRGMKREADAKKREDERRKRS